MISAMSSVALLYPAVPSESFFIPNPLINYVLPFYIGPAKSVSVVREDFGSWDLP